MASGADAFKSADGGGTVFRVPQSGHTITCPTCSSVASIRVWHKEHTTGM
jgi:hypothetical protein